METKPKTNADRIRAMSDEKLAEKVSVMTFCVACPVTGCDPRQKARGSRESPDSLRGIADRVQGIPSQGP